MHKLRIHTIVTLTVVASGSLFFGAAPHHAAAQAASDAFDGQWRYEVSCSSCHGAEGNGIYAFGPALKGDAFVMNAPPATIINVIQNGRYNRNKAYPDYAGMPAFYYIRAGEAQALVEYLKGALQQ